MRTAVKRQAPGLRPIERSLTIGLLRAREAVMARFRPLLNRHGVTEQQWRVIRVLAERRTADATEVAAASCIHPASLSRILRDLAGVGVLVATASSTDSRRLVVKLTAAGRRRFREVGAESELIYRCIEAELGATEVAATLARVNRLAQQLVVPARDGARVAANRTARTARA